MCCVRATERCLKKLLREQITEFYDELVRTGDIERKMGS